MTCSLIVDDKVPGVRFLTINRPERLNALDGPTLTALRNAVRECSESDVDVRVIVIRGVGRAFSTGSDLKWLASGILDDPSAHMRHQDLMQETYQLLESSRQVVIGAINGLALAGGLELALCCDILIADQDAELGDEHIRKNLLPSGGSSQRLPRKIGISRAMYYMLTGRRIQATEAVEMGLVSLAVPGPELDSETRKLAEEIAQADPQALASMKAMIRYGCEMPLTDGLRYERWMQLRYRNESSSMVGSVKSFVSEKGR